jgi:hypothetical protein
VERTDDGIHVRSRSGERRKAADGQFKRATFLSDYFDYTFYLQNSDGSSAPTFSAPK